MSTLFSTATTAGTAAGVAVGASLVTVGTVLLVVRRLRSRRHGPEQRVTELVRELDLRLRKLGEELSEELARTKEESLRSRFLGELSWSIELKEVMARTLDAAVALPGVDAAMITVLDAAGEPVTSAVGLSEQETSQLAIERPPRSGRIQSMTIAYSREPTLGGSAEPPPVATSVAVPVEAKGHTVGVLSVFSRDEFHVFDEATQRELEELAARAGPAVHNARRFQEARRLAELDPRTGLHNERYFEEALGREVARARRYGRRLALIVLDLDDFKQINDRYGHLAGDAALRGVAERLLKVLRSADIACRLGGAADEFGVILYEASLDDAQQFYARVREEIDAQPIEGVGRVGLSAGIAEYDGREEAHEFRERADAALYRAKQSGKGRLELAPHGRFEPRREVERARK
ncbi:MAG TPA: sensor domain-containing diguanylate cyclase [Gaiellaceae bacterium]|nr:sensor domain-containing diguanylate cyclase [Gaiellaceae bacterium]